LSLGLIQTGIDGLPAGGFSRGSLVLLAGEPGTGKTVFAAQFLYRGAAEFGENGVYVSFAESRDVFFSNMRSFGFEFERLEKEGRFKFLDMVTVKEEGVSTMLEMVLGEVHALGAKRLVVDSYTVLAQASPEPIEARILLHTLLGKVVRQAGCTTLLVAEIPVGDERIGLGVEEFVADVVIRLRRGEYEGRLLRELEVLKFRGAEVNQPKSVFTIKGGFKVFPPLTDEGVEEPVKYRPIPHSETSLSSGIRDLDEVLGQMFRRGTYNLIEVGRDVPFPIIRLVRPTICNFASQGHGVIILPPRGVSAHRIKSHLVPPLDGETFERYVRVVDFGDEVKDPYILKLKGQSIEEDLETFWNVTSKLREQTGKPVLSVLGYDSVEYMYGWEGGLKILGRDVTLVRNLGDVRLNVIRPTIALAEPLRAIADVYIRVDEIDGALFLYGVKPKTPLYSFDVVTEQGVSEVKLTPVV